MSAYMIISVTPEDDEKMREYEQRTLEIVTQFGGRPVARDADVTVFESDDVPAIGVILEFPSKADVQRWYDSPEYAPLKAFRQSFATASALVVEA